MSGSAATIEARTLPLTMLALYACANFCCSDHGATEASPSSAALLHPASSKSTLFQPSTSFVLSSQDASEPQDLLSPECGKRADKKKPAGFAEAASAGSEGGLFSVVLLMASAARTFSPSRRCGRRSTVAGFV